MIIYWIMFAIPFFAGISSWKARGNLLTLQWLFYSLALIFIIGFRYKIGGDWGNYIYNYDFMAGESFANVFLNIEAQDVGFLFFHYISINYFEHVIFSNLVCAAIFVIGLMRLVRSTKVPWLALIISISYLVIVVAMGYQRQAAALGFLMWAYEGLRRGDSQFNFYIFVL